ncbi:MAG: hypothetical protein KAG14_01745 [Mycoplasmataceae bacterium]|nr:hypothetical protein [Mycoplasmataceae bacterium]
MSSSDTWKGIEYQKYLLFYAIFKKLEGAEKFIWGFERLGSQEADFIIDDNFYESKTGILKENIVINTDYAMPEQIKKAIQQLAKEIEKEENKEKNPFIVTNKKIIMGPNKLAIGEPYKVWDLYSDIKINKNDETLITDEFLKKVKIISWPVENASKKEELDKLLRKSLDNEFFNEEYGIDTHVIRSIKEKFCSMLTDIDQGDYSHIELLSYYSKILDSSPDEEAYDDSTSDETKELIILMKEMKHADEDLNILLDNKKWSKYERLIKAYKDKTYEYDKIEKILRRTEND